MQMNAFVKECGICSMIADMLQTFAGVYSTLSQKLEDPFNFPDIQLDSEWMNLNPTMHLNYV